MKIYILSKYIHNNEIVAAYSKKNDAISHQEIVRINNNISLVLKEIELDTEPPNNPYQTLHSLIVRNNDWENAEYGIGREIPNRNRSGHQTLEDGTVEIWSYNSAFELFEYAKVLKDGR